LGRLPIHAGTTLPQLADGAWNRDGHFVVAMRPQEAAWLQFQGKLLTPYALKVGVGDVDAITGLAWDAVLRKSPQNYVVCPYQPWLDGFKVGPAVVRQFVAVPIGAGLSVEQQQAGGEVGGLRLASFAAHPDRLDGRKAPRQRPPQARSLAIGAGGRIKQRIYPDPLGFDVWESSPSANVWIHMIDADEFTRSTGEAVPPSPIDADTYSRFGFPWFQVYDAGRGDLPPGSLTDVKSVEALAGARPRPTRKPRPKMKVRPIPPRARRRRP
jgi:hypothetical protein